MIDCTNKNIYYKKRRNSCKFIFVIAIIIIFVISIYLYYNKIICDQIFKICGDYAYSSSSDCVNSAVLISLNDNVNYEQLINVEKDSNGDISLITTNSYKVNNINRQIANITNSLLCDKFNEGVPIPSLAFTGISFLSGYGKTIHLKTVNTISVICDFYTTFKSVGINQTLHSLYIDVIATIDIQVPFNNKREVCTSKILLSESILVGKVPEIYLNGRLNSQ